VKLDNLGSGKWNVTIIAALEDVSFHLKVAVFSTEMDIGGKHHLDIGFFLRKLTRGSHGGGSSRVRLRLGLCMEQLQQLGKKEDFYVLGSCQNPAQY